MSTAIDRAKEVGLFEEKNVPDDIPAARSGR